MWKFTKSFPKLFFIRSYENSKFCSNLILSCFLFVVHVAIALEQYVEVKAMYSTVLADASEHRAAVFPRVPADGRAAAVGRCKLASRCARDD